MSYSFLANKVLECFFKSRTYFEQYYPYNNMTMLIPAPPVFRVVVGYAVVIRRLSD